MTNLSKLHDYNVSSDYGYYTIDRR